MSESLEDNATLEAEKEFNFRLVFDLATAIGALVAIIIGVLGYQQGKHAAILAEKNTQELLQPRWHSQRIDDKFILTSLSGGQKPLGITVSYLHPETGKVIQLKDEVFSGDLGYGGISSLENKFFDKAKVVYASGTSGFEIQEESIRENNGRQDIAVDHRIGWHIAGKYPIVINTKYSDAEGTKQIASLYEVVVIAKYHPESEKCDNNYFLSQARNANHIYDDSGMAQLNFLRHLDKNESDIELLNSYSYPVVTYNSETIVLDIDILSTAFFWVHEC